MALTLGYSAPSPSFFPGASFSIFPVLSQPGSISHLKNRNSRSYPVPWCSPLRQERYTVGTLGTVLFRVDPVKGTLGGMTPITCELEATSKPLPKARQPQTGPPWREAQPGFSGDLYVSGLSCLSFYLQRAIRAPLCCGHRGSLEVHTEVPGGFLPGGPCQSCWLWCWHVPEARVSCVAHHPGGLFPPLL